MLRPAWRRNAAASMRSCRWRGLCADCFKGQWELPYRQIPWALPFQISKAEATDAFHSWLSTDLHCLAELSVFAVRPVYVPYYVFVGQLKATFDGVVAYGEKEYALRGIKCPAVHLGADAGRTTGVYAGFDFRRKYVRTALPGDLTDELLSSSVPFTALPTQPEGLAVEAFRMKPSFAYVQRIQVRCDGPFAHSRAARPASTSAVSPSRSGCRRWRSSRRSVTSRTWCEAWTRRCYLVGRPAARPAALATARRASSSRRTTAGASRPARRRGRPATRASPNPNPNPNPNPTPNPNTLTLTLTLTKARPPSYTRVEHVRSCHELDDARCVHE